MFSEDELTEARDLCRMPSMHDKKDNLTTTIDALQKDSSKEMIKETSRLLPFTLSTMIFCMFSGPYKTFFVASLDRCVKRNGLTFCLLKGLPEVFDTGTQAHKCSCLFPMCSIEFGNLECKLDGVTKLVVASQLRKNIKISGAPCPSRPLPLFFGGV